MCRQFCACKAMAESGQGEEAAVRQRVNTRVMALSAGRWDIVRPVKKYGPEEWLELFLMKI